ncbi:MAG: hypothetical protein BLM47_10785 [Candidatus Reconcilbacillus cellulovorans]|uniref:DNA-binding response regulator n=1 Tax=Candidatus Reconcilbacillus cellulovorans TaxID=1906605 RepID=A0A2A6DYJ3_9BACL|nr:MAG: hypothetical protein BLM47_10785 [Candidatus Reconcilbacillus cellulovorans]
MKVLIADDERHVLEGLRDTIDWKGLGVRELEFTEDGRSAWEKFVAARPDLVITDMNMPHMDGIALIRRIREIDPDVPIVVLSAYDDFVYTKEAIHFNVSRYILKPSVPREIEREIRDVLREAEHRKAKEQLLGEYREQFERHLPALRELMMHQLLTAGEKAGPRLEERLRTLGVSAELLGGGVVIAARPDFAEDCALTERDKELYLFALSNMSAEIAREDGPAFVSYYAPDDCLAVLLYGEPDGLAKRAKRTALALADAARRYLRFDVFVGIGRLYRDVSKWPQSFREAREALKTAEMEGESPAFFVDDPQAKYPVESISRLFAALAREDGAEVAACWEEIGASFFRNERVTLAMAKMVSTAIICALSAFSVGDAEAEVGADRTAKLLRDVLRYTEKETLYRRLNEIVEANLEAFRRAVDPKSLSYVDYVKRAVAERYSQKVSFAELARELGLHRNYLSFLFKKETGMSFMQYLTRFRIEKAKSLLAKKRYMVYEVAEMVGYSDPAYFSRMFKQVTGLSPVEFVLQQQEGKVTPSMS